jgi:hypothetical protein
MLSGKDGQEFTRALIFGLLRQALEAQSLIANQVHILSSQQGQEYVPYLTAELNKILATNALSGKQATDLIKLLMEPAAGVVINNNLQQNNGGLTVDAATVLIKNEGYKSLLEEPHNLSNKLTELSQLGPLPEIRAQYQDLNSIGIKVPNKGLDGPRQPKLDNEDHIEIVG